jgi:hypothetical protein
MVHRCILQSANAARMSNIVPGRLCRDLSDRLPNSPDRAIADARAPRPTRHRHRPRTSPRPRNPRSCRGGIWRSGCRSGRSNPHRSCRQGWGWCNCRKRRRTARPRRVPYTTRRSRRHDSPALGSRGSTSRPADSSPRTDRGSCMCRSSSSASCPSASCIGPSSTDCPSGIARLPGGMSIPRPRRADGPRRNQTQGSRANQPQRVPPRPRRRECLDDGIEAVIFHVDLPCSSWRREPFREPVLKTGKSYRGHTAGQRRPAAFPASGRRRVSCRGSNTAARFRRNCPSPD